MSRPRSLFGFPWFPRRESRGDGGDGASQSRRREAMVGEQIERRGVRDPRVLAAMRKVERHLFVPAEQTAAAYEDRALSIGAGQTISQPYIVAVMLEQLALTGVERVLEVGTGCGYQAAVLSELAREVVTIEIVPELHERAKALLADLGCANVACVLGDGNAGWPERAPYGAIVVAAAPDHVPPALVRQLEEGGQLVLPVGTRRQELVVLTRRGDRTESRILFPVVFVPLTGEPRPQS